MYSEHMPSFLLVAYLPIMVGVHLTFFIKVKFTFIKITILWIKDLNVRPEAIKLLEKNIGKTLSDINHRRILYDSPPE